MSVVPSPTAALVIIGNEILSGRTQDVNLATAAKKLVAVGIPLKEVRVIPDVHAEIIASLNALRARYTYVFTTGGIGPTHDDITVDAVAAAFGVPVIEDATARTILLAHYGAERLTPARLCMARVPHGAQLIANPVSAAPGIKMENVFVMAGVPAIMRAMMDNVIATLRPGPPVHSISVAACIAESIIAEKLGAIALQFPQLDIGSYPWEREGKFGTSLVTRGTDLEAVRQAADAICVLVEGSGTEAILSEE